jgi:hypothetical protein
VSVHIDGEAGGDWTIERGENSWQFSTDPNRSTDTVLTIPGHLAWKLFTKAVSPEVASDQAKLTGNFELARPALEMLAVMALR